MEISCGTDTIFRRLLSVMRGIAPCLSRMLRAVCARGTWELANDEKPNQIELTAASFWVFESVSAKLESVFHRGGSSYGPFGVACCTFDVLAFPA